MPNAMAVAQGLVGAGLVADDRVQAGQRLRVVRDDRRHVAVARPGRVPPVVLAVEQLRLQEPGRDAFCRKDGAGLGTSACSTASAGR
jgi:hypothetical protein